MRSKIAPDPVARRFFPSEQRVQAKAIACERPAKRDEPLSRYSLADIVSIMKRERIVSAISRSTLCRWYQEDALRPWRYRHWLFPRDPQFLEKATVVLGLYHGFWNGERLGPDDYVLSADEKSQLQILNRRHATRAPIPGHGGQVEFEYERLGTLTYQAALDVNRGIVIGQIESSNCIATFNQLVNLVMTQPPYNTARRVFWVVDNGGSHHPSTFPARLASMHEHAIAINLPIHASWLNQIELYFSILERKALTPRDFNDRYEMAQRILAFEKRFSDQARPFNWKFTAEDLRERMKSLAQHYPKNL
jgi:hypothetical protein